jgi:hypothetical protein
VTIPELAIAMARLRAEEATGISAVKGPPFCADCRHVCRNPENCPALRALSPTCAICNEPCPNEDRLPFRLESVIGVAHFFCAAKAQVAYSATGRILALAGTSGPAFFRPRKCR